MADEVPPVSEDDIVVNVGCGVLIVGSRVVVVSGLGD